MSDGRTQTTRSVRPEPRDRERERADERLARLALYGRHQRPSAHLVDVRRVSRVETFARRLAL